jgi:hypothetical protein
MFYSYAIQISNYKDKKPLMVPWGHVCKVYKLGNIPFPKTPELLEVKRGLAKALGLTLDDVVIYIDETPIL